MDSSRWGVWVLWILLTALGYSLGLYAGFFVGHFALGRLMAALAIGGGVGLAQRSGLQRYLEPRRSRAWSPMESATWIYGSMAGMAVAYGVGWLLVQGTAVEEGVTGPVGVLLLAAALAVGGAVAGALQARVLRKYLLDSRRWIAAAAAGWAGSSLGLGLMPALSERMYDLFAILLAPAVAGSVLGVITGYVLVRLPRRSAPLTPPAANRSE